MAMSFRLWSPCVKLIHKCLLETWALLAFPSLDYRCKNLRPEQECAKLLFDCLSDYLQRVQNNPLIVISQERMKVRSCGFRL